MTPFRAAHRRISYAVLATAILVSSVSHAGDHYTNGDKRVALEKLSCSMANFGFPLGSFIHDPAADIVTLKPLWPFSPLHFFPTMNLRWTQIYMYSRPEEAKRTRIDIHDQHGTFVYMLRLEGAPEIGTEQRLDGELKVMIPTSVMGMSGLREESLAHVECDILLLPGET